MSIRKKAGLFFIGRVVYSLSHFVLVILLTKLASMNELDLYMYAIALASPIVMFSQMNMRAYLVTDYDNEFNISDYIKSRKYLAFIAFIVIVIIGFVTIDKLTGFYILFFVTLFKTIESSIDIYCGLFQREFSMKLVAVSNVSRGVTLVMSMLAMLWLLDSVVFGLMLICIAWLCILYRHSAFTKKCLEISSVEYNYNSFLILVKKCLPLGFVMLLVSLNFNIPVYLIKFLNAGDNIGIYSSIAYLLLIGKVISESFVQASAPKVSEFISKKDYIKLEQLSHKLFGISAGLGGVGLLFSMLFGELFLSILYGDVFATYSDVFIITMLAALFGYISQVYGMILTAWRSLARLLLIHTVQVVTVIIIGFIYIPSMGIRGAAWALASGYFVIMLLNMTLYKINMNKCNKLYVSY